MWSLFIFLLFCYLLLRHIGKRTTHGKRQKLPRLPISATRCRSERQRRIAVKNDPEARCKTKKKGKPERAENTSINAHAHPRVKLATRQLRGQFARRRYYTPDTRAFAGCKPIHARTRNPQEGEGTLWERYAATTADAPRACCQKLHPERRGKKKKRKRCQPEVPAAEVSDLGSNSCRSPRSRLPLSGGEMLRQGRQKDDLRKNGTTCNYAAHAHTRPPRISRDKPERRLFMTPRLRGRLSNCSPRLREDEKQQRRMHS